MGDPRPMPVADVRVLLAATRSDRLAGVIALYSDDDRAGVVAACTVARRRLAASRAETRRLKRFAAAQAALHAAGFAVVAGLDEVGRGALAGPVTAGAVIIECGSLPVGVNDSKLLTPDRREELDLAIRSRAVAVAVGHVDARDIDRMGIAVATEEAMRVALAALVALGVPPDHALVDGRGFATLGLPTTTVVKGDSSVGCIAAASIVAKVARDALMREFDGEYPEYGFAVNKGYGTAEHLAVITRIGPSEIHRRSFAPCSQPSLF
jgi:ribonuclease HII